MTTQLSLACFLIASTAFGGELRGRVLLGDRPTAGFTVSAVPYETPFQEARREARRGVAPSPLASVKTAADGTFKLSLTAAVPFRLLVQGPGVVPALTAGVYDGSEVEDVGDLPLAKAAPLAGRVVTADGKPVAGAEVRLLPGRGRLEDASDLLPWPRTVTTRPDGTFLFDEAAENANRLSADAPGFATVSVTGLRAGAVSGPIVLTSSVLIAGTVRKADGRTPAAGAVLRFEGKASSRWVETGVDGSFRVGSPPEAAGKIVADGGDGTLGELAVPAAPGRAPVVVLKPAAILTGRVVDAKSARPVARVRVAGRVGGEAIVARSGPGGRYRIEGLLPRRYRLEADEPRYVPYAKDDVTVKAGERKTVDLPLTLGASLSGRVVDENGAPVAGARGRLTRAGETGLASMLRQMRGGQRFAFRTGADGSFKASRLAPGDNQRLVVTHEEYERRTLAGIGLPAGGVKAGLRVVLRRGITLSGLVLDENRSPLGGAEVELSQSRTFRAARGSMQFMMGGMPERRPRVTTGPDGRFQFRGLSAGEYALNARKPGFADGSVDPLKVAAAEATEPVELTLTPGATITGRVVRPNGTGAEGFIVVARLRGQSREAPLGPRGPDPTGPDGAFTLEGLRPGQTYELQLLGPTGLGPRKEVEAPAEGIEIAVGGTSRIAGRVLDAKTGAPIVDFEPSWGPDLSGGPGGAMVMRMAAGPRGRGVSGDAEAVHSEDGSFTLDDVPAGTWAVSAKANGYQTGRVGGVVVEASLPTENVEVRLSPAATLTGRVSDARSGRPVLDAAVSAEPASGAPGPRFAFGGGETDVTTDADGHFEVNGLGSGKYKLTARHPDFSDGSEIVEIEDAPASVEIRLAAGAALAGTVLSEAQRPLPGVDVTLSAAGEGGGFGRFGSGGDQATMTDEAGRFRFDHLAGGRYTVSATLRGRSAPTAEVVLQPGESRDGVTLRLEAGATVRGAVSGLPEAQRAGVSVTARGPGDYFASMRTAADGLFDFAGVPAGPVDLRGTAGDFFSSTRSAVTQVVVPEGAAEVTADLVFEAGFTISGRVTRAGGPVADAFVNASLQGGGGRTATARTDGSGSFALEGLQEGTYNVFASLPMGGSSRRETVKVEGDTTVDLDFPSARLAGTVVEAGTREALPDAVVEISDRDAGFFRMAATDSNGRFGLEDLEPKTYPVTARRAGYRLEKRDLTAAEQGADNLVFELSRGEGIGLRVRDGVFGVPLRGLFARAIDATGAPVFTGSVTLDDEGRGEIPSLRPGRYTLIVDASGYAARTLEGVTVPAPMLNVSLTPGGALELQTSQEALATGPIKCRILLESGGTYFPNPLSPTGELILSTPIRRIDNVASGRYTLVAEGKPPKPFAIDEGGMTQVDLR